MLPSRVPLAALAALAATVRWAWSRAAPPPWLQVLLPLSLAWASVCLPKRCQCLAHSLRVCFLVVLLPAPHPVRFVVLRHLVQCTNTLVSSLPTRPQHALWQPRGIVLRREREEEERDELFERTVRGKPKALVLCWKM